MNKVALIGRLTKDAETRYTPAGMAISRFTLAVRRKKDEADFISCKAFGKTAELLEKYVKKGDQIGVSGRIETGSYDGKNGKVYTTEVIVDDFDLLGSKKEQQEEKQEDGFKPAAETPFDLDEELPF